jgi:integrase
MLIFVHEIVHEYAPSMAKAPSEPRTQGSIRKRGNTYQVRVYAGIDPVTGKANCLTGTGRGITQREAENNAKAILRKLLSEVDEQRNARTKATFGTALDAWLRVTDLDETTREGYETYIRRYVRPALDTVAVTKITAQVLEELYAQLRRCRARCNGRIEIDHRLDGLHECRTVQHLRRPGRPPAAGYPEHDCATVGCRVIECQPHACRPLAPATIRKLHYIVSGTLSAAVRWEWINTNPTTTARKPRPPASQPDPPSPEDAARIIAAAWEEDDDWGTFVWLTMVTGVRRAEQLALRWSHADLQRGMLEIRRDYVWAGGRGIEKDTKTHRMRRIALDPETVEVLRAHRSRYEAAAQAVGTAPTNEAFLFSYRPLHDQPCSPDGVSHRYSRMCAKLGIDSHLHALRHYSATELLTAGVDLRTVAGRLGHGGGGATTLRVYAAWVSSADRQAAEILGSRMTRPDRCGNQGPGQADQ